jgi:hypothetical protein
MNGLAFVAMLVFEEELNPRLFFKQMIDKQNTTYNQTECNNIVNMVDVVQHGPTGRTIKPSSTSFSII